MDSNTIQSIFLVILLIVVVITAIDCEFAGSYNAIYW